MKESTGGWFPSQRAIDKAENFSMQWRRIVLIGLQSEWKRLAAAEPYPCVKVYRFHYNDVIMSGVLNHQPHDCLLNRLFRRRSKKTSKLHVTGLCAGNSPVTGEFPAQRASNAENVSIWWRHHVILQLFFFFSWQRSRYRKRCAIYILHHGLGSVGGCVAFTHFQQFTNGPGGHTVRYGRSTSLPENYRIICQIADRYL